MKHYPKTFEDSLRLKKSYLDKAGSLLGTPEEHAALMREFLHKTWEQMWLTAITYVWFEQNFMFDGKRRRKRWGNGHAIDLGYSQFMKFVVGVDQKPLTFTNWFTRTVTYIKDFHPDFLQHNPLTEPERFKFPYKHVGLDQMGFVHMYHDRIALLNHSEEKQMSYAEFENFAINHMKSYNEEMGEEVYVISSVKFLYPYIRLKKMHPSVRDELFNFRYAKHPTEN